VVELSEDEACRLITDDQLRLIKQKGVQFRLGTEIDLKPAFDRLDEKARKANQLDSLMRSITECKTLVFPDPQPQS
jgi:hypothetical protein